MAILQKHFKRIFVNRYIWISDKIARVFVSVGFIGDMSIWMKLWLGAVRQRPITSTYVYNDTWHHIASLSQTLLIKGVPSVLSIANTVVTTPDSKVHGANMGPIWGRQDPGGPHVGPMNLAIWAQLCHKKGQSCGGFINFVGKSTDNKETSELLIFLHTLIEDVRLISVTHFAYCVAYLMWHCIVSQCGGCRWPGANMAKIYTPLKK